MNGAGNSKATINPANTTEMICMTGALIITMTKGAERGGALMANAVRWERVEGQCMNGRWTHCNPPGSRNVPPTKSQKNLRQIRPQKPAQKVSADIRKDTSDKDGKAVSKVNR